MNEFLAQDTISSVRFGAVVWLTGCPGSGKTTLARGLEQRLTGTSCPVVVLDGDAIRAGLSADLDFSPEARSENVRRVSEVAVLLAGSGIVAIAALVSPCAADRQRARRRAVEHDPPLPFLEIYVDAPLEVRESRDAKGMYARARAQDIANFTGLTGEYRHPCGSRRSSPHRPAVARRVRRRSISLVSQ